LLLLDLALAKRIPIKEQLQLDFRAEVFNVFNRAMYANPGWPDFGFRLRQDIFAS
jgi:hypothetical protein